jgi:putative DNA primase/helicase
VSRLPYNHAGYRHVFPVFARPVFTTSLLFDAGNLAPVAKTLREKMPDARIIICADDDYQTEGNPGVTKAKEAARICGGVVATPDFGDTRPDGATDFNDLRKAQGMETGSRPASKTP